MNAFARWRRLWLLAVVGALIGITGATAAEAASAGDAEATLFYDAHVFTADIDHPYAEAVAIRGDRIVAVGTLKAVARAAGAGARKIDLHGAFLMPGMIDAHAHPIAAGVGLIQANYRSQSVSIPALVQYVAAEMKKRQSMRGDVLVINGIGLGYWSHAPEIDAALSQGAFAQQPIVLVGSDGHTSWANQAARARAGITQQYIRSLGPGERRYYGVDAALNPNGFVVDQGQSKLDASLPPFSAEFMLRAGQSAVRYMNSLGITAWLDAAVSGVVGGDIPVSVDDPGYLPVYQQLGVRGELTAHVSAYPVVKPDLGSPQIDVVEALRSKFKDIPNFTIPGLKVFADGVVEFPSQTAALTKPYTNTGRTVPLLFTPAKMNALVTEAARRGLNVHIHAIGDLAVKASLDAFEAARKAVPASTSLPFTITHAQFVDPEDIPRFGQLHVIAALQLLWADEDPSTMEELKPYIDPSIYRCMYPARSILDTGGEIAGASDWPVSSPNPFIAIYVAETRRGPEGVLDPAQRMPREAMLYAYTRNAADALGEGDQIGSIAPGKQADLALIDRDVLSVPAEELKDAKVLWTMFGGRVVFGSPP